MYKNLRFFVSTKNKNALNSGKLPYFYFNFSATSPPSKTLFSSLVSNLVSSFVDSYLFSSSLPNVCCVLFGLVKIFSGFNSNENSKLLNVWYFSYKRNRPNAERNKESCGISTRSLNIIIVLNLSPFKSNTSVFKL